MPSLLNNRAIIVLGMHRSGTSALTGALGLLGVELGGNLMPASSVNEAGFYEHQEVVAVHDRLLLALGSRWDDVARLPAAWWGMDAVKPFRKQLGEIITRDFAASALWGLKDPRMCKLLPLWTSLLDELGCDAVWVLLARHPSESGRSLEKRDGFSPEKSRLLWLQHSLDAERETRNRTRVVIAYDQLLQDWKATLERVQSAMGLAWPVSPGEAEARIKEFVDPGKRHHRGVGSAELPPCVRETYEGLLAGADGDEKKMEALLGSAHAALDVADALYQPVIRDRAADLEKSLTQAEAQSAAMTDKYIDLRDKYRATKEKLAAKSAECKTMKEQSRRTERSAGGKLNRLLRKLKPNRKARADAH